MKKLVKLIKKLWETFWIRLLLIVGCILAVLALGGVFVADDKVGALKDFIIGPDTLAVFLAAFIALLVATIGGKVGILMEESLKLDDDHHKIIAKYNKVKKSALPKGKNFYSENGVFMFLYRVNKKRKAPKNPVSDKYSEGYAARQQDIDAYMLPQIFKYDEENEEEKCAKLYLPNEVVFANVKGDIVTRLNDSAQKHALPSFVQENVLGLMQAHKNSKISNSVTIRLNDILFDPEKNELQLNTGRTQYLDMLVTNRCMDFAVQENLSLRAIYESGGNVSTLANSKLSNQIGINGLVFTKDGYLLIEKRGIKKAIWKNKFSQPISLALKAADLKLGHGETMQAEKCSEYFRKVIYKTLAKNFAITENDIEEFDFSRNFMGIARDLLEGGKPNMYFYVVLNTTAKQTQEMLQQRAKQFAERKRDNPELTFDKLDNDYYLVPLSEFSFNYTYETKLAAKNILFVKRKYAPQVSGVVSRREGSEYRRKKAVGGCIKRECGDALLACLCFVDICRDRIKKETSI